MSYDRLHHDIQSSYTLHESTGSRSPSLRNVAAFDSDEDAELEDVLKHDPQEGFELSDLTAGHNGPNGGSDRNDGIEPSFNIARRGSASTTHSFMLYTPEEERSVKRKFDRRLVLFVAFLYMLSFLDRSSKYV